MTLLWDNALLTGNDLLDKQHKELIKRVGHFLKALETGVDKEDVTKILEFLSEYAAEHFRNEEKLMALHKYPEYKSQKQDHAHITKVLSALLTYVKDIGVTAELVAQTHQTIYDWLKQHIHEKDKKFAAFLKHKET